ncbi:hypothetical protein AXF14_03520 [Actinomyces radicidentis]|uniref:Uncharacterized protein n=2 Tax=Actinomyces radicidentis TaxID=111015 RepID=A0A109W2B3_ACTRD|nr:hypothetical protein AXF14_03520 [Actinomyces radicidentis]
MLRVMARAAPDEALPAVHGSNATWLTDDEARHLIEAFHRLQELVPDFAERRSDPSTRPEVSHLYEFVGWLLPVEDELWTRHCCGSPPTPGGSQDAA